MIRSIIIFSFLLVGVAKAQNINYQMGDGDSSFSKMANAVNGYDIIGLGESAHGIKELHTWEFSFIKYLITTGRLKAIVIEDNFPKINKLNEYIQNGDSVSDLKSLIGNLYNIWQSDELFHLIEFMRGYNLTQKNKNAFVYIIGADMQDASGVYDAYNFLKESNVSLASITQHDLDLVAGFGKGEKYNFKKLPKEDKEHISGTIASFQKSFDSLSKETRLSRSKKFMFAYQNFKIVAECYQNETAGMLKWMTYRNKALAENVIWAKDYIEKGKQIVFMAHNGHLANKALSTGKYIQEKDVKYYSILQDFMEGEIVNNYSLQKNSISVKNEENMLASYFVNQQGDMFFIDFLNKGFRNTELSKYLAKNNRLHNFGADNSGTMKIKPGNSCSAAIIYRKVTSSID